MKKRIALAIALILLVTAGGTTIWAYRQLNQPVAHLKRGKYIEIPRGSSPTFVVNKLHEEGIIKHKWPLALYLKLTSNGSRLRAGEYDFPSPISPLGAFAKLREGQQRLLRLTVVEGWTRWDIANAMSRIPEFDLENPTSALPLMDDVSAIQDLDPKATNLEGYLFPDTYEFARDATPAEVIGYMVKRFRKEWKPDWSRARKRPGTFSAGGGDDSFADRNRGETKQRTPNHSFGNLQPSRERNGLGSGLQRYLCVEARRKMAERRQGLPERPGPTFAI